MESEGIFKGEYGTKDQTDPKPTASTSPPPPLQDAGPQHDLKPDSRKYEAGKPYRKIIKAKVSR